MKAYLRSPDEVYDGAQVELDPGQDFYTWKDAPGVFYRHDVRCGTTMWVELWEEGYTPPHREETVKPKAGRGRGLHQ